MKFDKLFTLVLGLFFAVEKLLSSIRSHLFIFVFISISLGGGSKRYFCDLCQRVFCLCFPLRVVWYPVLHLGLKSILSLLLFVVLENVLFFYM